MDKIDLHMHSEYSDDGEYSAGELVKRCKQAGIKVMAIADHNCVRAISDARRYAKEAEITLIPAIEIDCDYQDVHLHVLGYGVDETEAAFTKLEKEICRQEIENSDTKLRLTNELGFELQRTQLEELSANGVFTGEMFAEALLKDERYLDHPLLKPYREGGARGDNPYVNFFWDYYAQGKPCETKVVYPDLAATIEMIGAAGGISVLAHPGNNLKGRFDLLDEMVKEGLQGVECFSNYHTPEINHYFYQKAKDLNLLFTCGSDFHGKTKPAISLGVHGCENEAEVIAQLKEYGLISD